MILQARNRIANMGAKATVRVAVCRIFWIGKLLYFNPNQGGPRRPSDATSIESNRISNRSNRNLQNNSNGRKIARMARIWAIFGRLWSSRRNLSFQKDSNDWRIIESMESIDSIDRSMAALIDGSNHRSSTDRSINDRSIEPPSLHPFPSP